MNEIRRLRNTTIVPEFSPAQWKMLKSLYSDDDKNEIESLELCESFLHKKALIISLKNEIYDAQRVYERYIRLDSINTDQIVLDISSKYTPTSLISSENLLNSHEITVNILKNRYTILL